MRMRASAVVVVFSLLASLNARAQVDGGGFDRELYERFISMRTGDGDPDSGERITAVAGKAVRAIAYPYQLIEYRFDDDRLVTSVEQGRQPRIQRIEPGNEVRARRLGDGAAQFTAPPRDFAEIATLQAPQ